MITEERLCSIQADMITIARVAVSMDISDESAITALEAALTEVSQEDLATLYAVALYDAVRKAAAR